MTWLLLSLLSAVFLGLYDVAKKAAVNGNAVFMVLFASGLAGMLFVSPAYVLTLTSPGLACRLGLEITALPFGAHALIMLKAVIVTTSWGLTFFALKSLPISLASPVRASAPMLTVLGAVAFFGERLSAYQTLGVALTLASYVGFSVVGRAEGIRFERNRSVWLLFAGTLVGAISGLYDKHLMQVARLPAMTMQFWFTVYNALLEGILIALFRPQRRRDATPFEWRWSIVAIGGLLLVADALYFRALAWPGALVGIVSTVRRSSVVIGFVVGGLAFRERNRLRKAVPLAGVLAGLYFLLR
jgi:transporter family protein